MSRRRRCHQHRHVLTGLEYEGDLPAHDMVAIGPRETLDINRGGLSARLTNRCLSFVRILTIRRICQVFPAENR